jgi:hypothetical protein
MSMQPPPAPSQATPVDKLSEGPFPQAQRRDLRESVTRARDDRIRVTPAILDRARPDPRSVGGPIPSVRPLFPSGSAGGALTRRRFAGGG